MVLPARRHSELRADGSRLEYSIPAGVTDEDAAIEAAAMLRAVERGYTWRANLDGGFCISARWLVKQPAPIRWLALRTQRLSRLGRWVDAIGFWFKRRALDVYWYFQDRKSP